jgi:hypothetical protein
MSVDSKTQLEIRRMTPQSQYQADTGQEPWIEPGTELIGLIRGGDSEAFNKLQAYAVIVSRDLTPAPEGTSVAIGQLTLDLDQQGVA